MILENDIEICIISYVKRIASLGLMQDTGCLGLVHWDDPERWYGEGGGRGVQDWELMYIHEFMDDVWRIHVDVWQNQYSTVK